MIRRISILHRTKKTIDEEARPTMVAIEQQVSDTKKKGKKKQKPVVYKLDDEDAELDFLFCRFPVDFAVCKPGDDISAYTQRHVKWEAIKDHDLSKYHESQLLAQREYRYVTQVCEELAGKQNWRKVGPKENVTKFRKKPELFKSSPIRPGQDHSSKHESQLFYRVKKEPTHVAKKIPIEFDGIKSGDQICTIFGGSGGPYACAIASRVERLGEGTAFFRIAPVILKNYREAHQDGVSKQNDHLHLLSLFRENQGEFARMSVVDQQTIRIKLLLQFRIDAQEARKAAFMRHNQRLNGGVFFKLEGIPNQKSFKEQKEEAAAKSPVLNALMEEERRATAALKKAVEATNLWQDIFKDIEGVGPVVAATLIAHIGDIQRFKVEPNRKKIEHLRKERKELLELGEYHAHTQATVNDLLLNREQIKSDGRFKKYIDSEQFPHNIPSREFVKVVATYKRLLAHKTGDSIYREQADCLLNASKLTEKIHVVSREALNHTVAKIAAFCGVHTLNDGSFPRKRSGQVSNWNPRIRQALYLLGDQFNKRPGSKWGEKLREVKGNLRKTHPDIVIEEGKKRYTNGHIQNMARWKTLFKFVRWLSFKWMKYEEKRHRDQCSKAA